jgi:DNA-binding CsgD family transcriptional regulator
MKVKFSTDILRSTPWTEPAAFATDRRNRVVYWNGAAERLLGIPESSVLGNTLDVVLSKGMLDAVTGACVLDIPGAGLRTDRTIYLLKSEVQPLGPCPLTPREIGIVEMLADGYAALNIAARLGLSHATVRNHVQNILRKLDVHSQVEAVALAIRRGWVDRSGAASPRAQAARA